MCQDAHDGQVLALERSPFFKDIILTVGGWTFAIWKEGVTVSIYCNCYFTRLNDVKLFQDLQTAKIFSDYVDLCVCEVRVF